MKRTVGIVTAITTAALVSGCGASKQASVAPVQSFTHGTRAAQPLAAPHGAEMESGRTVVVSEGNVHVGFPPGATVARTANGIRVSFNGITRTFSPNANIAYGEYHKYAAISK